MDVELVRWPGQVLRRDAARAEGRPVLLLVPPEAPVPVVEPCLEDWIRVPAREEDVRARVHALLDRSCAHRYLRPEIDEEGMVRFRGSRAPLSPVEARIAAPLVERFGAVVGRDALSLAGWPEGAPGRNALDVHILRIRRRLEPIDLAIRTVRSRGYLLETTAAKESGQVNDQRA